ncbi:MAG: uracil-DNA glycosylase [Rickettsiales bacterium]|nr:uracil-DNA glycosylase [Rickettsiales bacterium]
MQKYTLPDKNCPKCERLCDFHEQNRQKYPPFFNGAVPSFGALEAEFLVVGLAPGLKGANATGRPFTGDYAGDLLYPALARKGFMQDSAWLEGGKLPSDIFRSAEHQTTEVHFELDNARITNAVRCVPPENKPTTQEIAECNPFLLEEIKAMENLKVILTLGLVSHKAVLKALGQKQSAFKFEHSAVHEIDGYQILNSYHTSRYNVNTGRLTLKMFDEVISKAQSLL